MSIPELCSIIQKADEERVKLQTSVYAPAGPLAHRAWHLSLATRASLSPSFFFWRVFVHSARGRMSPGSARKAVVCTVHFA